MAHTLCVYSCPVYISKGIISGLFYSSGPLSWKLDISCYLLVGMIEVNIHIIWPFRPILYFCIITFLSWNLSLPFSLKYCTFVIHYTFYQLFSEPSYYHPCFCLLRDINSLALILTLIQRVFWPHWFLVDMTSQHQTPHSILADSPLTLQLLICSCLSQILKGPI